MRRWVLGGVVLVGGLAAGLWFLADDGTPSLDLVFSETDVETEQESGDPCSVPGETAAQFGRSHVELDPPPDGPQTAGDKLLLWYHGKGDLRTSGSLVCR